MSNKGKNWKTVEFKSYTCHTGNNAILRLRNGGTLYAGGWTRGANPENEWAVIDLTGTQNKGMTQQVRGLNHAANRDFSGTLKKLGRKTDTRKGAWLSLPIRDYDVPAWNRRDWLALAVDISNILKRGENVLVACTGGHGRTGLFVAIIAGLILTHDEQVQADPIAWVRKNYCYEAVETIEQERYVYRILERDDLLSKTNGYTNYGRGTWLDATWVDEYYEQKEQVSDRVTKAKAGKSQFTWIEVEDGYWHKLLQDGTMWVHNDWTNEDVYVLPEDVNKVCEICGKPDCMGNQECKSCLTPFHPEHDGETYCRECRKHAARTGIRLL